MSRQTRLQDYESQKRLDKLEARIQRAAHRARVASGKIAAIESAKQRRDISDRMDAAKASVLAAIAKSSLRDKDDWHRELDGIAVVSDSQNPLSRLRVLLARVVAEEKRLDQEDFHQRLASAHRFLTPVFQWEVSRRLLEEGRRVSLKADVTVVRCDLSRLVDLRKSYERLTHY